MADLSFEKVQMDTSFQNCQNIYNKLSKILELVDVKQFGAINQINEKILTLSTDMYKLLCIAESVSICNQKFKGNNFTSKSNIELFSSNSTKIRQIVVSRQIQCNIQNSISSDLGEHSLQVTPVQKATKSCQTSDVIEEKATTLNISEDTSQTVIGKISSEFYNNISYKYNGYFCNYCNVTMKDVNDSIAHINNLHHKNVCDFTSGFLVQLLNNVCSVDDFWTFIPQYLIISKFYVQPTGFTCTLCKCALPNTLYAMYLHMSDKEHIKKVPMSLQVEYKNVFAMM